ncbi:hypothetical protein LINPERPRIM_LOCUS14093 [Linum perenne]|jgi:hypothetical protein
MGGS